MNDRKGNWYLSKRKVSNTDHTRAGGGGGVGVDEETKDFGDQGMNL